MTPARIVIAGGEVVRGIALVTDVPLSFWGGVDPATGTVIDQHHPLRGKLLTDRILILPSGRGSCSASGVLLEAIYQGSAPAAIITHVVDPIIGLGAILADELYGLRVPVLVLPKEDCRDIASGDSVAIQPDGQLILHST